MDKEEMMGESGLLVGWERSWSWSVTRVVATGHSWKERPWERTPPNRYVRWGFEGWLVSVVRFLGIKTIMTPPAAFNPRKRGVISNNSKAWTFSLSSLLKMAACISLKISAGAEMGSAGGTKFQIIFPKYPTAPIPS